MHNRRMAKSAIAHKAGTDLSTLSGRLAFALLGKDSNPNQVETATGVKRQTLYAVLAGRTQILTWDVLTKIAENLGVRPEWLQEGQMPIHPVPELRDEEEIQLIYDFREMSHYHRRDLADIAKRWAEEDSDKPHKGRPFQHPKAQKQ